MSINLGSCLYCITLFLVSTVIASCNLDAGLDKGLTLGPLKKRQVGVAGVHIWLKGTEGIPLAENKAVAFVDPEFSGVVNINGQDIEFEVIEDERPDENFEVGKGGREVWKGEGIGGVLEYEYTWLCEPNDEGCSVYQYEGELKLVFKGKTGTFKVVGFGGS